MPRGAPLPAITRLIGSIPYRMALAGGWIDQPFCSRVNPSPPGSMVVVSLQPSFPWMQRAGMATGTRTIASRLWGGRLPEGAPAGLVECLYEEENRGRADPSGSQDMIGLVYPGINRLDYDFRHRGGIYPCHIETTTDPDVAHWLEQVVHVIPVGPRPPGYHPLGERRLTQEWVERLGVSGRTCYQAILSKDVAGLGAAMNDCMTCWESILPHTVRHPLLRTDLVGLLRHYQAEFEGAMYSGCGGGYLYVASEQRVPGSLHVDVRLD
jgi:hypothetical protein